MHHPSREERIEVKGSFSCLRSITFYSAREIRGGGELFSSSLAFRRLEPARSSSKTPLPLSCRIQGDRLFVDSLHREDDGLGCLSEISREETTSCWTGEKPFQGLFKAWPSGSGFFTGIPLACFLSWNCGLTLSSGKRGGRRRIQQVQHIQYHHFEAVIPFPEDPFGIPFVPAL